MATRRLLLPLIALLVAAFASGPHALADEPVTVTPAQSATTPTTQPPAPPAPDSEPTTGTPTTGTPTTVVADNPFGLPSVDPLDGGRPIPDASVEVVHRWTITPEGSNDPDAASSRSSLSYIGERGSVITDGVTVFNLGNEVLTFHVFPTDAVNGDDGAFSFLSAEEPSTGVGTWVSVEQEYVTLEPGMASTIPISITIPDDASPGDHVGGVIASSATAGTTDDGTVIGLNRGVGTRLYVRVAGPLRPGLVVEGMSVDHDASANPLQGASTVSYRIQNRGNVRLSGTHQLTVAGPFGIARKVGDEVPFTDILPGQSIAIATRVEDVPTLGWVSAAVELTANGADGEGVTDQVQTTALALPIVVLMLILLIGLVLGTARRIRRHRRVDADAPVDDVPDRNAREHQLT